MIPANSPSSNVLVQIQTFRLRLLLVSLLLQLLFYPFVEGWTMGAIVLLCLTAATLLTGVYLVSQNTRFFILGCALAFPTLASDVVEFLTASTMRSMAKSAW